MTTTFTKAKSNLSIMNALVVTCAMVLSARALAADYSVEARCSGARTVKVINWNAGGTAIYVSDHGRQLYAGWATKSVSDAYGVEIVTYTAGDVLRGGASLRIRTRDDRIQANEGSAHLTYDFDNNLLACSVF